MSIRRTAYACLVLILIYGGALSATPGNPASRGVITLDGVPGMFLNPTSGTLKKGEISIQACVSSQDWAGSRVFWKGAFGAYGLSDRFELGFSHAGLDDHADDKSVDVNGPAFRYRFLDEAVSGWEGSIGAYWRPGTKYVARTQGNLAFSRKVGNVGKDREIRLHLGVKSFTQDGWWAGKWVGPGRGWMTDDQATIPYGGLEVQLPNNFYLIGEVAGDGDFYTKTPWALGVQYKMAGGFGCSIGAVQPGYAKTAGFFFGIGINFD